MAQQIIKIDNNKFCEYCLILIAKFILNNGKYCCEYSQNKCPSIRKKLSNILKKSEKLKIATSNPERNKKISEATRKRLSGKTFINLNNIKIFLGGK